MTERHDPIESAAAMQAYAMDRARAAIDNGHFSAAIGIGFIKAGLVVLYKSKLPEDSRRELARLLRGAADLLARGDDPTPRLNS